MAKIEGKYLQQLRDAGLFVSPPFKPTFTYPDAVWVGKPTSIVGNSIPEYTTFAYINVDGSPIPPEMDAPRIMFCSRDNTWLVISNDYAGGFMPSDFNNEWPTPEQAVADILDLYFGDSRRMQAKAESKASRIKRL